MPNDFDDQNYYDVLRIERNAPVEVIRKGYRRLMQHMKAHPDLGGDTETAALINKAYSVLSDPLRRVEYDARLEVLRQVAQGFAAASTNKSLVEDNCAAFDPYQECAFCGVPHDLDASIIADARCAVCKSPLSPADNQRIEPADQRAVERICRRLEVLFFTHWDQSKGHSGRTEDISLNGLRLVANHHIRKGQRIRLVNNVVEAVGYVTHCIPKRGIWKTEYVAGVSFVTLKFVRSVGGFVSQRV